MFKSRSKQILLFSLPVLFISAGLFFSFKFLNLESSSSVIKKNNKVQFSLEMIKEKEKKQKKIKYTGGIVPHHVLAKEMIDDFFIALKKNRPELKTIIVLGPNHLNQALFPATTTTQDWVTDFGVLENNDNIIEELTTQGLVKVDEESFLPEYSIAVLTLYIKKYYPEIKIVPIIFTTDYTQWMSFELARQLSSFLTDDVVVISSLDFSHYLSLEEAEKNDELTWQRIKNYRYRELVEHNSDYFDSPATLMVLMKTMQLSNFDNILQLDHKTSVDFDSQSIFEITSYFTVFFY